MITDKQKLDYAVYLQQEERSRATISKYLRDIESFQVFLGEEELTKETVIRWKRHLLDSGYAVRSVNSMLAAVNSYLVFIGRTEFRVKNIKIQQRVYVSPEEELAKEEYLRLLDMAKRNERLFLLMQTVCATGIRISELQFFTVEAVKTGEVTINCKGKTRTIIVPGKLNDMLWQYAGKHQIDHGPIFVTRTGRPMDRSNVWRSMKLLCHQAHVDTTKVYPHNLRKLFARTFYSNEKDIALLADVLGHSSINTTRIYLKSSGKEHRKKVENLNLLVDTT